MIQTQTLDILNKFNDFMAGPQPDVGVGDWGYDYVDLVFNKGGIVPKIPTGLLFVEVQDAKGKAVNYGKLVKRDDGHWVLRIPDCRFDKLEN